VTTVLNPLFDDFTEKAFSEQRFWIDLDSKSTDDDFAEIVQYPTFVIYYI